jgi:hypothetical protein
MRIVVLPAPLGKWHGWLYLDEDMLFSVVGQRPGCVVRDLLNWAQYNYASPTKQVTLEITEYE